MMPMKVPRRTDVRTAKETADAEDRPVSRSTVQREVEAPSEGVKRKAKTAAKNRSAKVEREAREKDKQAIMQETLEATAARAQASEAELAARGAEDEETRNDALEEMATANANLTQMTEIQAKQIADLRDKLATAEGQVAHWREYATKMEEPFSEGCVVDSRDFPNEKLLIGGWTKRETAALRMLETIVSNSPMPEPTKRRQGENDTDLRTRRREELDRWVENRAELSVHLADALFDFMQVLDPVTPAPLRREVREGENGE